MATETQYPDVLLASTNLTGTVGDIDEDVDSPDGNWLVSTANDVNTDARCSYPTPSGTPNVGADLQSFRVWVKKSRNKAGNPTCQIELWENGGLVRAGSATSVTSTTGEEKSFTWNANELSTADGSLVEIKVVGVYGGSGPSDYTALDIGAVNWEVDYSPAAIYKTPTPAASLATGVNPSPAFGAISRTPSPAVAATAATATVIVLGELATTPAPATTASVAVSAGLAFGGIARGPPPAVTLAVAVTPTAEVLSVEAFPAPAPMGAVAVTPTVQLYTLRTPAPAVAASAAVSPGYQLGALTKTPVPAATAAAAVAVGLSFGGINVTAAPAATASVAVSAGLSFGGISITAAPAPSATVAVTPGTTLGEITRTPAAAPSATVAVSPGYLSDWIASPQPAPSAVAAVTPYVDSGATYASPAPAATASTAVSPGTTLGNLNITAAPATSGASAPEPGYLSDWIAHPLPAASEAVGKTPAASVPGLQWYNRGKWGVLSGNIDLQADTIRVMLVGTGYTFAATHNVVNDVVGQELSGSGYSRKTLAGKSVTEDDGNGRAYFDATDVLWEAITVSQIGGVILFQFVTDDSDSRLLAAIMFGAWPAPSGEDLTIGWNAGGILEIG